jgi:hypothetical protein
MQLKRTLDQLPGILDINLNKNNSFLSTLTFEFSLLPYTFYAIVMDVDVNDFTDERS